MSDSIIDSQQSRYHLMQHLYPHTQAKYGYPDLEVTYLNRNEIEATQYMHFTDLPVRLGMLGSLLLLLVCVSFTIIGQPRNSVLIRRV